MKKIYAFMIALSLGICFAGLSFASAINDMTREGDAEVEKAKGEMDAAFANLKAEQAKELAELNDQSDERVMIELKYPAGESPKVFTRGWVFGAKCLYIANPDDDDAEPEDISSRVHWEGSGTFSPAVGKISHPSFSSEGDNTMILSVDIGGKKITKTYHIIAVSPDNYARVSWLAECPADSHGCPKCPHEWVRGPIIDGSKTVIIDGLGAARVGDPGVHSACCGPNEFVIEEGDPEVLIDGRPAARVGDKTKHCGGVGKIIR